MESAPHHNAAAESGKAGLYCGVDIGASATKLVLLSPEGQVVARSVRASGIDYRATAHKCLAEARAEAGTDAPILRTVSTGYGRANVDFADRSVTEIHCHGVACFHMVGGPATLTL